MYKGCKSTSAEVGDFPCRSKESSSDTMISVDTDCALFDFVRDYSITEIKKLIFNTLETIQNTVTDQNPNIRKDYSRRCKW